MWKLEKYLSHPKLYVINLYKSLLYIPNQIVHDISLYVQHVSTLKTSWAGNSLRSASQLQRQIFDTYFMAAMK